MTTSAVLLNIAAVERATGLSKDVLRAWERRYGFPRPSRDAQGRRGYDASQLRRLQYVRQLIDLGQRPHHVVALDEPGLQERLSALSDQSARQRSAGPSDSEPNATWPAVLRELNKRDAQGLFALLRRELASRGLPGFVLQTADPLIQQVGQSWASGEIGVDQEHLFSEVMTALLANATLEWPLNPEAALPRMVFTTVPGEAHGLGLRMAQAICAAEGASTLCLGLQTPLTQTVDAVRHFRAHVLALSFSAASPTALVASSLSELRSLLPEDVSIWVGGQAVGLRRLAFLSSAPYFRFSSLTEIGPAVRQLRARVEDLSVS